MILAVTDQPVDLIAVGIGAAVLGIASVRGMWVNRPRADPYHDLAREDRARAHGALVRARRRARRNPVAPPE